MDHELFLNAADAFWDVMMHALPGLLSQVLARPDDDGPRLVYADWLDELGDHPRAEFIRVQLALATIHSSDRRRATLRELEARLLTDNVVGWSAPLATIATSPVFRRGFVHSVNQTARQFIDRADELFSLVPLQDLHLLDLGGENFSVFDSPQLSRLSGLTIFAQHQGFPLAVAVAECRHLFAVKSLNLGRNEIGCEGLQQLTTSPYLAALENLDLSVNHIAERGLFYLAERASFAKLRRLELADNLIGASAVERLVQSNRLPELTYLGLSGNRLWSYQRDDVPLRCKLLDVPVLDLSNNGLTVEGIRAMLLTDALGLRELDLSHNRLRDDGVALLSNSPAVCGLRSLKLAANEIGDVGLQSLANSPFLGRLEILDVNNNPLGDNGLRAVVESRHLTALRKFAYPNLGLSHRLREAVRARYAGF